MDVHTFLRATERCDTQLLSSFKFSKRHVTSGTVQGKKVSYSVLLGKTNNKRESGAILRYLQIVP